MLNVFVGFECVMVVGFDFLFCCMWYVFCVDVVIVVFWVVFFVCLFCVFLFIYVSGECCVVCICFIMYLRNI